MMIQQKQSNKKHFDYNQRLKDYTEVKAVQEEYENVRFSLDNFTEDLSINSN